MMILKPEGRAPVLRLKCPCGRNLADVTTQKRNPTWTQDELTVYSRPGVSQRDYQPQAGSFERTYTWDCPGCKRTHTRRHERLSELWEAKRDTAPEGRNKRGIIYCTLDVDV